MLQGLQCFDTNGNIILDITDRLTRVLGEFETELGTKENSFVDDGLLTGIPWWVTILNFNKGTTGGIPMIVINIEGNVFNWQILPMSSTPLGDYPYVFKVIYGVY